MEALGLSLYPPISFNPKLSGTYAPTTSSFTLFHPPTIRFRPLRCSGTLSSSVDHWSKFSEAAEHGNLIPLYRSIPSGHLTPETAYRCLVKEDERDAPSFLFESVEPGLQQGRFSAIGAQPRMEIVAYENMVTVMDHREGRRTKEFVEDPMVVPRRIMEKWKPQRLDELPEAFCGGWVGYFSYDTVRYVEKKLPFSSAPKDDRNLPDIHLGLYDEVIVFDHVEKKAHVMRWVFLDQFSSVEEAFKDGMHLMDSLVSRVLDTVPLTAVSVELCTSSFGSSLKSTMTSEAYKEAVLQAKEHILAGDIFQIVLSQRFERRTFADPFQVYRALRTINPSPYMAYLQARGSILVASSPEILTRVRKGKITNRPLAGTARRGKILEEDYMLEKQLLHDEKQCAEHIMLVDLARNDVGKVSKPGTVDVDKFRNIERYSHVMHISSTVTGELPDHLTSWDALRAALPVGTVSGAPKVRPINSSASFRHLSGHHFPSSLALSRLRTLRCSALSSRSLGAAGGADNDHSAKFRKAAEHGNLIPLYQSILSDHLTPVLAYRCLVKEDERDAPSFLFESVDPAGLHQTSSPGRYSVIGAQPSMEIVAKENMVTIMDHREGRRTEEFVEDPMVVPRRIMDKWKPQRLDELPEAFCGGWVGYFSYDTVHYVEKKKLPFLAAPEDDHNLPDVHLGLYDDVIVFDHVEKKAFVIHWVQLDQFSSVEEAFNDGMNRLNTLVSRVPDDIVLLGAGSIRLCTNFFGPSLKESTITSEAYKEAVLQAKEHILAGDIFQILLSQRFERRTFADPFEVYRALRIVNPSPYMTYLQARGCILVASSPEILARAKKVTGESLDHLTSWDALRAALPVGTVSGVPKV
ncbi:hypothetical protein RHGRI_024488 [Rhododendron griersonianum]|nr:hypothetical protein RHGRI_024488 [Rhododendron griersonianum]